MPSGISHQVLFIFLRVCMYFTLETFVNVSTLEQYVRDSAVGIRKHRQIHLLPLR